MKFSFLSTPSPNDAFFVYKDGYHDDINQTYSFFLFSLKAPSTPKGKITFGISVDSSSFRHRHSVVYFNVVLRETKK